MSLALLFHYLMLNMFRMLVGLSSGACDLLWIYFMCCIALVRCWEACSDVWLTVHRNSVWIRKTNYMSLFVFFISLLIVAQHVSGKHVPIIRS